jgi:cation/acetate symporter
VLREGQQVTKTADGKEFVNGLPKGTEKHEAQLRPVGYVSKLPNTEPTTGPLGLMSFFSTLQQSEVVLWGSQVIQESDGAETTVYFPSRPPAAVCCVRARLRCFAEFAAVACSTESTSCL